MMKSPLLTRAQRARGADDSGAAMITALLAILITAMLAIVMLGVIMSQVMPTQLQQATTRTVFAAEAGINVVVGQIRAAEDDPDGVGDIYGKTSMLPCSSTGTVTTGGSALTYVVRIRYFTEDPTTKDEAWRTAQAVSCAAGLGPSQDPTHALLESSGAGLEVQNAPGDIKRTIEAVYAFQVTNVNIPGGFINTLDQSDPGAEPNFCLEARSVFEHANVFYKAKADCTDGDPQQMWLYTDTYQIKLAASTLPTFGSDPLCITGVPSSAGPVPVTLEVCEPKTSAARWSQMWSWGGEYTWQGQKNPISNGKSGYFLNTGVDGGINAGSRLHVWNTHGSGEWSEFVPDARVGAGAASYDTDQIVSYSEFGRCVDVTGENINDQQMISYPCKQDPDPRQDELSWNHKWYYDENNSDATGSKGPQQVYVRYLDVTKYCLKSAGPTGGFVTFSTACTATDKHFQWTRYGEMDSYEGSYLFQDGYGYCLDLGPSYDNPSGSPQTLVWSTLVTSPCDGHRLEQKWNAEPNPSSAALGGYWELPK